MKWGMWLLALLVLAAAAAADASDLRVAAARQRIELTGYTRSIAVVALSAEVTGKVMAVNYDIGSTVGKAPFVVIDPTFVDFSIALARRRIEGIEASLAQIESKIDYLQKEFARIDALFRRQSTPAQRRDQARQELDQAVLERRSLAVEKSIQQTRLQDLVERRKRHDVTAPEGWVVTERQVDAGEIVDPSLHLATVADFRRLVVPLSVTSAELAAIRRLPAPFAVTVGGRPAAAMIRWVNPEFDEVTRKREIELLLEQWDGEALGGLVTALVVEVPAPGLSVPKATVTSRFENPRVRLAQTGEAVQVTVLGETDGRLRIAETPRLRPGLALLPAETP